MHQSAPAFGLRGFDFGGNNRMNFIEPVFPPKVAEEDVFIEERLVRGEYTLPRPFSVLLKALNFLSSFSTMFTAPVPLNLSQQRT